MPYIVVVIDEMADLMLTAGKEIEAAVHASRKWRARRHPCDSWRSSVPPSMSSPGTIKANFRTTDFLLRSPRRSDSRTILGEQGAEQLLGMGDLLFMAGGGRIRRLQRAGLSPIRKSSAS